MDLYEYGKMVNTLQSSLNNLMYAYHHNQISSERADDLADRFLSAFISDMTSYFKNKTLEIEKGALHHDN